VNVGRSSVRFEQELLAPGGEVAATAAAVLVAWDADARRSRTIDDDERARLVD
jgi:acyl-CoA thioesterase FadM